MAASAARVPDAGAAAGLALLVTESGGEGIDVGLFTLCLSLPHLVGPVFARRLDRRGDGRGDGRPFIAIWCLGYGAALAAAAVSVGRVPLAVSLGFVVATGLCGPVLTAGLSSQLSLLVPRTTSVQRRAQGLDALTYGIAGSAGPAVVAAIANVGAPLTAVLVLSGTAVAGAALMMTLPTAAQDDGPTADATPSFPRIAVEIVREGGLRRAMVAMIVVSFVAGSLVVLAVGRGIQLRGDVGGGALLIAAYGAGSLGGSVFTGVVPLRGHPDRNTLVWTLLTGVAFVFCGVTPAWWAAAMAFALAGFVSGPFFVATLAARAAYSPAGGRAQVFVVMGAVKISSSAAGAAIGGAVGFHRAGLALVLGGAVIVVVGAILVVDRRRRPDRPDRRSAA